MDELPEIVATIADAAGMDAAWTIVRAKGGQQVFIPARPNQGHWLVKLVGMEAAQAICQRLSVNNRGDSHIIPLASKARRAEAYRHAVEAGQPPNQVAAALGVHRRTVFRNIAKVKGRTGGKRQGDLF